jgi:hypothetical protein
MEVSLHVPPYPRGNSPLFLLYRRMSGPQSKCGCYGGEKTLLSLAGIEPRYLGRPASKLVAISTQLSRLHAQGVPVRNHAAYYHIQYF